MQPLRELGTANETTSGVFKPAAKPVLVEVISDLM